MNRPLQIFIGYDSRETIAYHVLVQSIIEHTKIPVSITPLVQPALRANQLYTREKGRTESTEFSLTRFLIPALCGYEGIAIFMDCDMLVRADLTELLLETLLEPGKDLFVCQHDYTPKDKTKFLGQQQTTYPRKNWSSLMVFRNENCRMLTPEYVNRATGLELHRFHWLPDEKIGALDLKWNWLVGEYTPNHEAKILHWTNGGPWFEATRGADHAQLWNEAFHKLNGVGVNK